MSYSAPTTPGEVCKDVLDNKSFQFMQNNVVEAAKLGCGNSLQIDITDAQTS